jgi:hypothetical protein
MKISWLCMDRIQYEYIDTSKYRLKITKIQGSMEYNIYVNINLTKTNSCGMFNAKYCESITVNGS